MDEYRHSCASERLAVVNMHKTKPIPAHTWKLMFLLSGARRAASRKGGGRPQSYGIEVTCMLPYACFVFVSVCTQESGGSLSQRCLQACVLCAYMFIGYGSNLAPRITKSCQHAFTRTHTPVCAGQDGIVARG